MRVTDFFLNVFSKYAPLPQEYINTLNVELSESYFNSMHKMKNKLNNNMEIESKIIEKEKEIEPLDPHTPEYSKVLFEIENLTKQLDKPTLIERAISFLEKPYVKLLMIVAFAIATRYIGKWLTAKPKEDEPEEEEQDEQEQNNFPPPYYPPYGYYPPQQGHQQYYSPYPNQPKR